MTVVFMYIHGFYVQLLIPGIRHLKICYSVPTLGWLHCEHKSTDVNRCPTDSETSPNRMMSVEPRIQYISIMLVGLP